MNKTKVYKISCPRCRVVNLSINDKCSNCNSSLEYEKFLKTRVNAMGFLKDEDENMNMDPQKMTDAEIIAARIQQACYANINKNCETGKSYFNFKSDMLNENNYVSHLINAIAQVIDCEIKKAIRNINANRSKTTT